MSYQREPYEEQFKQFTSDIAQHTVTVLREDGLYRHLRCRRGDSYTYGFDLITWPGYLAYTGDMGCFVFTRLPDMFEFFREKLRPVIDRGYFGEKAVAVDKSGKHSGIRAYSEDKFRVAVKEAYDTFIASGRLGKDETADLWSQIEDDVLSSSDNEQDAVRAAMEFRWRDDSGREHEVFPDFFENPLDGYTTRFWWCCYAIPWAIAQYDAQRKEAPDGTGTAPV